MLNDNIYDGELVSSFTMILSSSDFSVYPVNKSL